MKHAKNITIFEFVLQRRRELLKELDQLDTVIAAMAFDNRADRDKATLQLRASRESGDPFAERMVKTVSATVAEGNV